MTHPMINAMRCCSIKRSSSGCLGFKTSTSSSPRIYPYLKRNGEDYIRQDSIYGNGGIALSGAIPPYGRFERLHGCFESMLAPILIDQINHPPFYSSCQGRSLLLFLSPSSSLFFRVYFVLMFFLRSFLCRVVMGDPSCNYRNVVVGSWYIRSHRNRSRIPAFRIADSDGDSWAIPPKFCDGHILRHER